MKQLNNFINEKLKINKDIKSNTKIFSKEIQDKILDKLCIYFQGGGFYNGKQFNTRLSIVNKFFDNDIYKFFDKLDLWDDMSDYINIDCGELANYIEMNKEDLYEEIKDFVLDDILQ